jgi:hypothetical protein
MKVIGRSAAIISCALVVGIWYRLTPSIMDTDHEPVTQPQTQSSVTTDWAKQLPEVKPIVNPVSPAANQQLPTAQSKLTVMNQRMVVSQPPAPKVESTSRAAPDPQVRNTPDLSQMAQEVKLQEIEIQRLGFADADQVIQAVQQHPNAQVRKVAVEKLAQLEVEYEVTNGIERHSGELGQFVSVVAEHLPNESNPAALDASLNYLVEYAESDPTVRQSLGGLLQRLDLSPDVLTRVYELLIERYGLSRDDAQAQIYASPAIQAFGADDWRQLEESLAQLE